MTYSLNNDLRFFESLFKSSIQPMIVIDAKGIVQQYNASAEKLFQYKNHEIIGHTIGKIMTLDKAKKHANYLRNYQKTHESNVIGKMRQVTEKKKDGTECVLFLSVSEFSLNKKILFLG